MAQRTCPRQRATARVHLGSVIRESRHQRPLRTGLAHPSPPATEISRVWLGPLARAGSLRKRGPQISSPKGDREGLRPRMAAAATLTAQAIGEWICAAAAVARRHKLNLLIFTQRDANLPPPSQGARKLATTGDRDLRQRTPNENAAAHAGGNGSETPAGSEFAGSKPRDRSWPAAAGGKGREEGEGRGKGAPAIRRLNSRFPVR
jgi:hypothetical protein